MSNNPAMKQDREQGFIFPDASTHRRRPGIPGTRDRDVPHSSPTPKIPIQPGGALMRRCDLNRDGQSVHPELLSGLSAMAFATALKRGYFDLLYQPRVDMYTGLVVGVEASPVWEPQGQTTIRDAALIAMAERLGCRADMERWGVQAVCLQAAAWHRANLRAGPISFPCAGWPYRNAHLAATAETLLHSREFQSHSVHLEWNERALDREAARADFSLHSAQPCGVAIVLHDVSTALANLSRIRALRLNAVILSPSLIRQLQRCPTHAETVRHIIGIGQALELTVIAQGIDNFAQAGTMLRLGCRIAQGQAYAPAMTAAQLSQWMEVNSENDAGPR